VLGGHGEVGFWKYTPTLWTLKGGEFAFNEPTNRKNTATPCQRGGKEEVYIVQKGSNGKNVQRALNKYIKPTPAGIGRR